jgi:hypothetical protein
MATARTPIQGGVIRDIPDTLYNDPHFLEVVRELRKRVRLREAPPPEHESSDDEVTRRVRAKINLRMKQRQVKEKR